MAAITFDGRRIELIDGETVLEALLRDGVAAPSSCRAGACQSCLMKCTEGTPPAASQTGLKDALKMQGYFLPCVCRPAEDLAIAPPDAASLEVPAVVDDVHALSGDVVRLRLRPQEAFAHRAGQFVNLVREDGLVRSYSIASLPGRDDFVELHVRLIPGGQMSQWIARELRPGQRLALRGPAGECFYVPGTPDQPLLLVGTGTGLAPLWGIIHDASSHGHSGRITLIHGGLHEGNLYLVDQLHALASQHKNFRYMRCVLQPPESPEPPEVEVAHNGDTAGLHVGDLADVVKQQFSNLAGYRVYLCGHPDLVNKLRRQTFLAGAPRKQIHADAFVMAAKGVGV